MSHPDELLIVLEAKTQDGRSVAPRRFSDWAAAAEYLGSSDFAGLHETRGIRSVSLRLLGRPAISDNS